MFTRRSLFKFLAAAPVAAAAITTAQPTPPPLPTLAVPPSPPLTMGMGDYTPARFIVPQNPIPGAGELLGRNAVRSAVPGRSANTRPPWEV